MLPVHLHLTYAYVMMNTSRTAVSVASFLQNKNPQALTPQGTEEHFRIQSRITLQLTDDNY